MANYQSTHTGAQIDAGIDLLGKNSATSGQVLTANGTGGASWQNASGGGSIPNGFTARIEGRGFGAEYQLWYLGKLRNSLIHSGNTYNTDYGYNEIQFSDQQIFDIDNCVFCILKRTGTGGTTPYISVSLDAVVNGVFQSNYRKGLTPSEVLMVNLIENCTIVCGDDG